MTRTMRLALPSLLFVIAAPVAFAQGATGDSTVTRVETPAATVAAPTAPEAKVVNSAGPTMNGATVGVKANRANAAHPTPEPPRVESSRNMALMVVGFGGLIAGAIIGGDAGTIIMVGGAVIGLYGLFKYLE
jgi:hypothetical protein